MMESIANDFIPRRGAIKDENAREWNNGDIALISALNASWSNNKVEKSSPHRVSTIPSQLK